jgi:hypothetical protein
MAKIQVTQPFRLLLDNFQQGDYDTGVFTTVAFKTLGVYSVTDEVASHWYVKLFSNPVDSGIPATATVTPLEIGQ